MTKITNTFNQGLDRDSSKNKYDNQHYYDAKNMRLITQEGLSGGALENLRGTYLRLNVAASGHYICGHVVMGDYLVIWTTSNNTSIPNGTSTDRIFKVAISSLDALTGASALTLSTSYFHLNTATNHLVYEGNLWLSTSNLIVAVARYENANIQKVYWVDTYNRLRHINTVFNANTNDLVNMTTDKLEAIGDITLSQPTVVDIPVGNLKSGKIQYGYQLYGVHGAETTFSPLSGLINLVSYSDVDSTTENYRGSDIDENTGKSVKCTIDIKSLGYTRIRIIAVHYTSLAGDPEIRIVEEREISGTLETIYFTDTGETLGNLLLEDIRTTGTLLFSAEELETKDNILFPANITEESFDVDYDARTYRFSGAEGVTTSEPNFNVIRNRKARIFQGNDTYYEIDGATKLVSGTAPSASGSWGALDEEIDAINKFNDLDNDGDHEYRYMYQSDGVTIGGEGPYVSYEFKLKEMIIDADTTTLQRLYTTPESTVNNPSYYGYASPYNVEKYLGYHRDEIYRFGIVFFDGKGRSSFVKWIGDIRMPSISTISDIDTYNLGSGGATAQQGTITVSSIESKVYFITFNGNTYQVDNTGGGITDVNIMASALRNQVLTSGEVTCNSPVGGVFTITWYTSQGAQLVTTGIGPIYGISPYNETVPYAAPVGTFNDFSIAWNDPSDGYTKANVLYPNFTVSILPDDAESYQIVRVRRESLDRTVMAQGVVGGTDLTGSTLTPLTWNDAAGYSNVYTFASPEVAFNRNLTKQSNDFLQEVGEFDDNVSPPDTHLSDLELYKYNGVVAMNHPQYRVAGVPQAGTGDEYFTGSKTDIVDGLIVAQNDVEGNVGANIFKINNPTLFIDKGISFVFEAANTSWRSKDTPYTSTAPGANDGRKLINYRRNIFNTQYGGISYNNRRQNFYIAASNIISNVATSVNCFGGDTYVGMFDYLYSSWMEDEAVSTQPDVLYFPVETSINLSLRLDDCYHRIYTNTSSDLIHETAGVWSGGVMTDFAQSNDLYRYNTVYSKENDTKIYIKAPFDWSSETDFPVRARASNVKTMNEYTDSWLIFGVNALKDVDPHFGEITKLITVNEKLMFFQPKAFGILTVNERALLQTGSISQLSLGVSGVLDRFDYAKTQIGASDTRHVLLTPNGLYWIDTINKAMYRYTGGPEELSMMKGMDSFFRTSLVNGSTSFLFHDPEFKEVMVTDHTDNWTLVYSELTDSFTSFNDFFPNYVINYNDKLWGSRNNIAFYKHNDTYANRGYLYGSYYPSSITLLVNPSNAAVFNNMEWLTEVYTNTGVEADVTFDTIQFWNDYQGSVSTGTTLDGTNVKRRMRKWRHVVPRAVYENDGSTPKTRRDSRFRDTHLFVKLTYTNDVNDRRFITHDLTTSFTVSNM